MALCRCKKCDAGRPCATCKRSHAKAIASLTSSGQAVLADPCCTYDYAPGEDPWTATVRNGLGLSPPISRSKSGSTSPAGSSSDISVPQAKTSVSGLSSSSAPQIGPLRARHTSTSRKRSPPYPSPGKTPPMGYDSAYIGSPASLGHLSSTGAQDAFLSPLPPQTDVRGLPALFQTSDLHAMPPYVASQAFGVTDQDFEYEEMVQMLYNPMGPFYDPPTLLSPLPYYTSQLPTGEYPGSEVPIYAHDAGLASPNSGQSNNSTNPSRTSAPGHGILEQETYDVHPTLHPSDALASPRDPRK
ncbi:hypothetical protein RSOLAG22IIIB_03703 [Rhizoctonia solani]|uniref:Uncharacterized protein n=1 Tax=Rhizoctonia solani TaxID=456999 RepID=A0A0K6FS06_9AGAM|nr:hypothetical protein RSOLAG22IIIB_03703 [Rhizoctonia solani]